MDTKTLLLKLAQSLRDADSKMRRHEVIRTMLAAKALARLRGN